MLAAWLYRLKLQKVICLISCILLESPPISASFARQIIPLSETNNSWALWKIDGWKDKTKSFPFGMGPGSPHFFSVSVSGGKKSLLDPIPTTANGTNLPTLPRVKPPWPRVRRDPQDLLLRSPPWWDPLHHKRRPGWMTPHGKKMDQYGKYTPLPLKLNSLPPSKMMV